LLQRGEWVEEEKEEKESVWRMISKKIERMSVVSDFVEEEEKKV